MGLLVGGEVMSHQLLGQTLSQLYVQIYLNLWSKVPEFSSFLPQGKQEDFKTTVLEGLETAKHQVRVALDACHLARAAKSGIDACECLWLWYPHFSQKHKGRTISHRIEQYNRKCSQNKGKQNLLKSSGRSQPSTLLRIFEEMAGTFLPSRLYSNSKHNIKHRLRNHGTFTQNYNVIIHRKGTPQDGKAF